MSSGRVLGIDLGTTSTAFAVMEGGAPEIIPNAEGDRTTPSVVAFTDDGERLVGKPAKNRTTRNPRWTVTDVFPRLRSGESVEVDGVEYAPEMLAAILLQKIKRDAEAYLGEEVEKTVVSVPNLTTNRQRQATKDAGEIAGFDVERIVTHTAATSMAYGLDDDSDQTVLVYDLGGGTFDVSILDLGGGVYEVVATNGDNDLGGDDWDWAIVDWLVDVFEEEYGVDLSRNERSRQRLKDAAEEAKIDLDSRERCEIELPFVTTVDEGNLRTTLARTTFESLTKDLIERTVGPTEQALEDAGYSKSDIDEVFLVGGSTRMPQVREQVEELTGQEPRKSVNPDEAVALGAAIQGGVLSGDVDDIVLLDVTPLSLGVRVESDLFERLIERNTTIPTKESKVFTTAADNQTRVQVRVFRGEREIANENEPLGAFYLTDIPADPDRKPQIEVTFNIDENGIVNVEAEERDSGRWQYLTIEDSTGLSGEQVWRMHQEARRHAEEDQRRRERIEARNEAESAVQRAETLLEENEENVDDELREDIEAAVEDVEEVLEDEDATTEDYEAVTEALSKQLQEIGKRMYEQQQAQQQAASGGPGASPDTDVGVGPDAANDGDSR